MGVQPRSSLPLSSFSVNCMTHSTSRALEYITAWWRAVRFSARGFGQVGSAPQARLRYKEIRSPCSMAANMASLRRAGSFSRVGDRNDRVWYLARMSISRMAALADGFGLLRLAASDSRSEASQTEQ